MRQFIDEFFLKGFKGEVVGIFTKTHIITLIVFIFLICLTIYLLKEINEKKLIFLTKILAIIFVCLELIKIICTFANGDGDNLNSYLPLYFCSIFIYALILAGFMKGKLQKLGISFIGSGSIIAGFSFLIFPTTSFMSFPLFHYFSLYSYIYHSVMIILGVLYLIKGIFQFNKESIIYYLIYCSFFSLIALILNACYDTNFMFYKDAGNIPIKLLVMLSNEIPILYTIVTVIGCIGLPYIVSYYVYKIINKILLKKKKLL